MVDDSRKKKILAEIITSAEFGSSQSYKNLLSFLVESSIRKKNPKEIEIAQKVFGKNTNFNPNDDPTVRVYISNLRKKLSNYYRKEGKRSRVRIEIPKGHHEVKFIKQTFFLKVENFTKKNTLLYSIIAILALGIIFSQKQLHSVKKIMLQSASLTHRAHPFWANIHNSELPKLITLGDDFFYLEMIDGEETIVRKHYINSPKEYDMYLRRNRDKKELLGKTIYPFLPNGSLLPLPKILDVVRAEKTNLSITHASGFQSPDFVENDVIFLGSFRNLYLLNQALRDKRFTYLDEIDAPDTLKINTPDSILTYVRPGAPEVEHIDYCLVRKIPGPNHNTVLLFVSFYEIGVFAAVNYMTADETLTEIEQVFEKKEGGMPAYFDVMFRITGHSRTAFTTHIEFINKIDPNTDIW